MSNLAFAARHSMDSPEWYTPSAFVDAAREVMGSIDLDPASHHEANLTVKAARYYTEAENGLMQEWRGNVFLNPPGGFVRAFWTRLLSEWNRPGGVVQAVWIGYSLEQLQTLQACEYIGPMAYAICVPRRRIAFVENEEKRIARLAKLDVENAERASKGLKLKQRSEKADGPSHANYITYLGANAVRFEAVFSQFGQVRL